MKRLALVVMLISLAPLLRAQDTAYRFQVALCTAQGDLKDMVGDRVGFDFGTHALYTLAPGQILRPRIDFTLYPIFTLVTAHNAASSVSGGFDFIQFLNQPLNPVYLVVGTGVAQWSEGSKAATLKGGSTDITRVTFALGVGYKVNPIVNYELRYTEAPFGGAFKAQSTTLGMFVHF